MIWHKFGPSITIADTDDENIEKTKNDSETIFPHIFHIIEKNRYDIFGIFDSEVISETYFLKLHSRIMNDVRSGLYRLYKYDKMMALHDEKSVFLYKIMAYNYKNASPSCPYDLNVREALEMGGFSLAQQDAHNKRNLLNSLKKLVDSNLVLASSALTPEQKNGLNEDGYSFKKDGAWFLRIWPTAEFVQHTIKVNAIVRDAGIKLKNAHQEQING